MLVDSHCHLDRLNLDAHGGELANALNFAKQRGVGHFLAVCCNLGGFPKLAEIASAHEQIALSCGIHPLDQEIASPDLAQLTDIAARDDIVAIGETGLDYYYSQETKAAQKECFRAQIRLAKAVNKPLIIHTRDAGNDTLAILREEGAEQVGGVIHCFTESSEFAKQVLELGFYISLSGIVTFKQAAELRQTAAEIPLERLLVETDSPYLAPVPYRGKTNEPAYVVEVARCLAEIKGVPFEQMKQATTENYCRLFGISL